MTTAEPQMKAGVRKAIGEVRAYFADLPLHVLPSPCGGAFVIVEDVPLGAPYVQGTTWVGFFLSNACPEDDTYPFYVRGDLTRIDKAALKTPLHVDRVWPQVQGLESRAAVMVSRRQNNQSCCSLESPLLKLRTVLKWMKEL